MPYLGLEHVEAQTMRILHVDKASNYRSSAARFSGEHILYGRLRPYLNKVVQPKFDGLCSGEFIVLSTAGNVHPGFLRYLLNSSAFVSFASHLKEGDRPRVDFEQIAEYPIWLPLLGEQRRIVAEIEKQFTRLDEAESSLVSAEAKVNALTTSFLHQLLTGNSGDLRQPTPITDLDTLNRGRSRHRPRDDGRLFNGPYPFIQTSEVRAAKNGRIRDYSATYSQFGLNQSRLWSAGTLCITIAANIAETGILDFEARFPDSVVGFTGQNELVVKWVELFFRIEKHRLAAFAPATAQKNINLEILRSLHVPMPRIEGLPEILGTAERILSVAEMYGRSINDQIPRVCRLRQAILARAFSGQLVPQDPNDEPASVLLERIRTQRERNGMVLSKSRRPRTPEAALQSN